MLLVYKETKYLLNGSKANPNIACYVFILKINISLLEQVTFITPSKEPVITYYESGVQHKL